MRFKLHQSELELFLVFCFHNALPLIHSLLCQSLYLCTFPLFRQNCASIIRLDWFLVFCMLRLSEDWIEWEQKVKIWKKPCENRSMCWLRIKVFERDKLREWGGDVEKWKIPCMSLWLYLLNYQKICCFLKWNQMWYVKKGYS